MNKKTIIIILTGLMLVTTTSIAHTTTQSLDEDYDPLINIEVTVTPEIIRWLEAPLACKTSLINNVNPFFSLLQKLKDRFNPPQLINSNQDLNLYLTISINNNDYTSPIYPQTFYIYQPNWAATHDVPDDQENVDITIQLWHHPDSGPDVPIDLSPQTDSTAVHLTYSIATGHWTGDDYYGDPSGYGRLCGTDDGTTYQLDHDAELWFTITQTDYDQDTIPYWIEQNTYGTNPEIDNTGEDHDEDLLPIEYEHHWGFDPTNPEAHTTLDDDEDSITNYEEYLVSQWYSDPFRKDVYVEQDIMAPGPNGQTPHFPDGGGELIQTAFNRQNIVFHLDNGSMGGQDSIPFQENVSRSELEQIYNEYFLENDPNHYRRGIFHYGVVVFSSSSAAGYMYRPNAFQISSWGHDNLVKNTPESTEDIVYGSAYMHELGHTFGYWPIPGHNRLSGIAGILDWLRCIPYRSCMNYGYMYIMVDYSDGSRMSPDLNDWDTDGRMRLDFFEQEW